MLKKVFIMFIISTLLIGICGSVNATELKTKLDIIEKASETKYLENNQGYISKNIVDSNLNTGEVTINLSLSNVIKDTTKERYDSSEIFIIVSENIANDTEQLSDYISYIDTLTKKVFGKNSNTKIGVIGMKGTISDGKVDENGNMVWGENDEGKVEGTADNAEIIVNLTKNAEDIKNGLKYMNSNKIKYSSNLQAAIRLANNSYSKNVNKLLISLYDGVPIIANGVCKEVSYGGFYGTKEEAVKYKHEQVVSRTKSEILSLEKNNVEFILLRPDDTSYDETWYHTETGKLELEFDGSPYVQQLYGTLENPTYGKMYNLNNDNLEKIVTEYIYKDIIESITVDIKSAIINEYFSKDILENFDITFSDENVDTTNLNYSNYVVWNIGDILANKTANLQYTLKIKDMKNEKLLNKVISTSEKTELNYINYLDEKTTVVSTSSPKIQLSEVKEELTATVSYNPINNTAGNVTATIKTNKSVNEVDGWTLSEDKMTLNKIYTKNETEIVHLVDIDGMTKDITVKVSNIILEETSKETTTENKEENKNDNTTANGKLPQTGVGIRLTISILVLIIGSIFCYFKYRKLRDI